MIPQATLLGEQLILKLVAYFESGNKNFFSEFVEWLNKLEPPKVHASPRTLPRPFLLADILQRRLAAPYPCSRCAILTTLTCSPAQGWHSTPMKPIPNKRSCCWAPQGQPPPDLRRPVLRGAASTAGARALTDRARRGLRLRLRSRALSASTFDGANRRSKIFGPVSYTHLTLPTIYSV